MNFDKTTQRSREVGNFGSNFGSNTRDLTQYSVLNDLLKSATEASTRIDYKIKSMDDMIKEIEDRCSSEKIRACRLIESRFGTAKSEVDIQKQDLESRYRQLAAIEREIGMTLER